MGFRSSISIIRIASILLFLSVVKAGAQIQRTVIDPELEFSNPKERLANGDGSIEISGELKQWHKVTLTLDGPFAHELDNEPNPFRDYKMDIVFTHESGEPSYLVPAYFAADGDAAQSGADRGTKWRAHLSPSEIGKWTYKISFLRGENISAIDVPWSYELTPYHGKQGEFEIGASDKKGKDFRARGRLEYVGQHYLQFQGDKTYFFKSGADAPETLLAYEDIDGTYTVKREIKTWKKHVQDWKTGDPTWKDGKGKGLIGAVNYLSEKGANSFSFLTYNAGGDGDNVWPFVKRDDKYHYDCSKLDQWGIVFDHAQTKGMYAHFKTQETENDDNKVGHKQNVGVVIESLDGGDLGPQRRIYYRELMARYSYLLALNWNIGEENTQSFEQRKDIAKFLDEVCPYNQNIVIHTFPNEQDKVYNELLGYPSLTGVSLQNSWHDVHKRTLQWIGASAKSKRKWVVANDEQGSASAGAPPDPGYPGFVADQLEYDLHDIRKQTLWGNLMAGGAGIELYFGYKLPENDLICEDFRSRDKSWDYCKIAIDFYDNSGFPFVEMINRNDLIGNAENEKEKYCLGKVGELYLVYLGYAKTSSLDLGRATGLFDVSWFNPRTGGEYLKGTAKKVKGGGVVKLGTAPNNSNEDWLIIVQKK